VVKIDIKPIARVVAVAAESTVMVIRCIAAVTYRTVGHIDVGELNRRPSMRVMAGVTGARVMIGGRAMALEAIFQACVIEIDLIPVRCVVAILAGAFVMVIWNRVAVDAVAWVGVVIGYFTPVIHTVTDGTFTGVVVQWGFLFMAGQAIAEPGVIKVDHSPIFGV
jgi:hypothetical protein